MNVKTEFKGLMPENPTATSVSYFIISNLNNYKSCKFMVKKKKKKTSSIEECKIERKSPCFSDHQR